MSSLPRWTRVISIASMLALVPSLFPTPLAANPLVDTSASTLAREPQFTPTEIGDGSIGRAAVPRSHRRPGAGQPPGRATTVGPICRIRC